MADVQTILQYVYSSSFKFIKKFIKKEETDPQVARANLGRPDLKLFKDKINIIIVITITSKINKKTKINELQLMYMSDQTKDLEGHISCYKKNYFQHCNPLQELKVSLRSLYYLPRVF